MESLYSPYLYSKKQLSFYKAETSQNDKEWKSSVAEIKDNQSSKKCTYVDSNKLNEKVQIRYNILGKKNIYEGNEKKEIVDKDSESSTPQLLDDKIEPNSSLGFEFDDLNSTLPCELDRRSTFYQIMQHNTRKCGIYYGLVNKSCFRASMRRDLDPWTIPFTQERGKLKLLKSSPSLHQLRAYYRANNSSEPDFDKIEFKLKRQKVAKLCDEDDKDFQNLEDLKDEVNRFKMKAQNYFLLYKKQEKEINTLKSEYEKCLMDVKSINLTDKTFNKENVTPENNQAENTSFKPSVKSMNKDRCVIQKNKCDLAYTKAVHRIKSPEAIKSMSDNLQDQILDVINRNKGCITERVNLLGMNKGESYLEIDDKSVKIHEIILEESN